MLHTGALVVTLAMLLRLTNCRFIIIIINLLLHLTGRGVSVPGRSELLN